MRRLEQDLSSAELEPSETAALVFARRLSRFDPPISKKDLEPLLQAGFDAPTIGEIAVSAAYMCAANRLNTLPAIPTHTLERLPDRLAVRLVRPLLGLVVRVRGRRGAPVTLSVDERAGPFSYLVDALNGVPFARSVRRKVDEAWESPVVPPRTKALVFAVIARALGAPHAEAEALRLLDAEGFARSDADSALAHLSSPALDDTEAAAVPWARETVRYSNGPIQRSSRKLFDAVGQDRFVELVGLASLANMLARLDFLADGIA